MEKLRDNLEGRSDTPAGSTEDSRPLDDQDRLEALEQRGHIKLGSGKVAASFWTTHRPRDQRDSTRAALLDDREQSP
jgi:hypothetical protein